MTLFRTACLAGIVISLTSSSALAAYGSGGSGNAEENLSVSGGIAIPSFATSVFQNGAGMTGTGGAAVTIQGGAAQGLLDPQVSLGLLYGNGAVGLGAGVTGMPNGNSISTQAFYGLAVGVASNVVSFGITGSTGLSPADGTQLNLGLLLRLGTSVRLGFTARNIIGGFSELGAGFALNLNSWASLVVDATVDQAFKTVNAKPGILIGNPGAALTVSYGIGSGSGEIIQGFTAGGSLLIAQRISWQLYYNQLTTFYTAVSVRF